MKHLISILFLVVPSLLAGNSLATKDFSRLCTGIDNPQTLLMVRLTEGPDDSLFTELYLSASEALTERLARRFRLDPEEAEERVQALFAGLWSKGLNWPGDDRWTDEQTLNWLASSARNQKETSTSLATVNVTADAAAEQSGDLLASVAKAGTLSDAQLTQAKIDLLPDALHRIVLMRHMQGKTQKEIGAELNRSASFVTTVAQEAREVLSEVLKGRSPVLTSRHRKEDLMWIVQQILEQELAPRPVRMRDDAVVVTRPSFLQALKSFPPHIGKVATLYYLGGKKISQLGVELGLRRRQITYAVEKVALKFGTLWTRLWIIEESGVPSIQFRQADYAPLPKDPIEVSVEDYRAALKGWPLRNQQFAKMRFAEGLSNLYIAQVTGAPQGVVDVVIAEGAERVAARTKKKLTMVNLKLVGDIRALFTSEVRLPFLPYLTQLEAQGDPTEAGKLKVASDLSGLPVTDLARIVLVGPDGEPLLDPLHQNQFEKLPELDAVPIPLRSFDVVKLRLKESDARILELYVRHRFSYVVLGTYLGLTRAELVLGLERCRKQVARELGYSVVALSRVKVMERGRARTTQVDATEFRQRYLKLADPSVASVNAMVAGWKRVVVSEQQPYEIVDATGKPLFNVRSDFKAGPALEPAERIREADLDSALRQVHLTEQDLVIVRMRLKEGWGVSGIEFLLGLSAQEVRYGLNRARYALNTRLSSPVQIDHLKLITDGSPTVTLTHREVNFAALVEKVRAGGDYRQTAVLKAVEELTGSPVADLTLVVPVTNEGRPALAVGLSLVELPPSEPKWATQADLVRAVVNADQRLAMRLRYQYGFSRPFLERLMRVTDIPLRNLLAAGLNHLRTKVRSDLSASTLRISD